MAVRLSASFLCPFVLAACGGLRNAALPAGAPLAAHAHSWIDPLAKPKQILYVSDPHLGVVNLYDADRKDPRPFGQLGDLKQPEGLFVDSGNDIFVTEMGARRVVVYRQGSIFPFTELSDTTGYPDDVCAAQYSPTFYVPNVESPNGGDGQTIDVYANEAKKPTSVLTDSNAANLLFCAVNAKGDLYVTMENTAGTGEIDVFPHGKTTPNVVLTGLHYPTGIAFDDHDYLVLSETFASTVRVFAPPYGKGPKSEFSYNGLILQIALDDGVTHLWGADQAHALAQQFAYPSGVLENETQSQSLFAPFGVAVAPPNLHL